MLTRWLARGINPYVYVGNNPINARDPSGLGECWRTLTGTYVGESVGVTVERSPEEESTSGDTGAGDQFPTVPGKGGDLGGAGGDAERDPQQAEPECSAKSIVAFAVDRGLVSAGVGAAGGVLLGFIGVEGSISVSTVFSGGATAPLLLPGGAIGATSGAFVGGTFGFLAGFKGD